MSRVIIPGDLKGKPLFKFLMENKEALINEKKSILKRTEPLSYRPSFFTLKEGITTKDAVPADYEETMIPDNAETLRVKVVANACNWCDSQMDVLIADCWKRSIKDRKNMIPHLHDHNHSIEAKIGEVVDIYSQDMKLADLGLSLKGATQVLIFETDVMKSYNEKIFNQYKLKKINQHSIGLQYLNMDIAINDPDSEKQFDFWNKYYPLVINKDIVDESGFFFVVTEIRLLENSCVLFGSNILTPTIDVQNGTGKTHPPKGNEENHPPPFDLLKAIQETKFITN